MCFPVNKVRKLILILLSIYFLVAWPTENTNAFGLSYHADITQTVLSEYKVTLNGERLQFTNATILGVVTNNLKEDITSPSDSSVHFDNEDFAKASNRLIRLRKEIVTLVTNNVNKAKALDAQIKLGQALHTLQDFYAHTNWVELVFKGLRNGINRDLGRFSIPKPSRKLKTSPDNDPGTLLVNLTELTSGYYALSSECEAPVGKTRHGSALDKTRCPSGLNKDDPDRPYFIDAKNLATIATQDYLDQIFSDIKGNSSAVKALMGISTQASPPPPPPPPADQDGDGVYDDKDLCPGTPNGKAVDSDGCEPLVVYELQSPNAVGCVDYYATISVLGGSGSYSFALSQGSLPTGLKLNTSGQISGVPKDQEKSTFSVRVTDSRNVYAIKQFTLSIAAPNIVLAPAALGQIEVAKAYTKQISASGSKAPFTFKITNGAPPKDVTITTGGLLAGVPVLSSVNQTFGFTITAMDACGFTKGQRYALSVYPPTITLVPTSLEPGTAGEEYPVRITASGGTAPHSFKVSKGNLPGGLSLDPNGTFVGKISVNAANKTFNFTVTARDKNNFAGTQAYVLKVLPAIATDTDKDGVPDNLDKCPNTPSGQRVDSDGCIALTVTSVQPTSTIGCTDYNGTVSASGGLGNYSFTFVQGYLPNGLKLNTDGRITGIPTAQGTFTFEIRVTDSRNVSATSTFTILVNAPNIKLDPTVVNSIEAAKPYSQQITASGSRAPFTFKVTNGAPPTGITLSSGGLLSGTPAPSTANQTFDFVITATDACGFAGISGNRLSVYPPTITLEPDAYYLETGIAGKQYSITFTASGGTAPYTFKKSSGNLPDGLNLSPSGQISGKIAATAANQSFGFSVTATDANGFEGSRFYVIPVSAPTIVIKPDSLPDGIPGEQYSVTLTASGGEAPYQFQLPPGSDFPSGLILSDDGTISGVPDRTTANRQYRFTVEATDANGFKGSISYFLQIRDFRTLRFTNDYTVAPCSNTFREDWTTVYFGNVPIHTYYSILFIQGPFNPPSLVFHVETDGDRPTRPPVESLCQFGNYLGPDPSNERAYWAESWTTTYLDYTPTHTDYELYICVYINSVGGIRDCTTILRISTDGDRPPTPSWPR